MKAQNILVYVQHLLGSGHLVRAYRIANALANKGHKVWLVSGGFEVKSLNIDSTKSHNLNFIQLPPMKSKDAAFSDYVDERGEIIDDNWKSSRKDFLLNSIEHIRFHSAIIETYPFGRRQMEFEIKPLLQRLRKQTEHVTIFSSIRDILQQRKKKRYVETIENIDQYFDSIFVHSDPNYVKLEQSFPLAEKIKDKLIYTGYLYQPKNIGKSGKDHNYSEDIIVSAGGGAVGFKLLKTAILSQKIANIDNTIWRVLYSPTLDSKDINELIRLSKDNPNIIIEENRSDFIKLLKHSKLAICQSGYNTTLDILFTQSKCVMVPFSQHGETEQEARANALHHAKRVIKLDEESLTAEELATAINQCLSMNISQHQNPNFNGIETVCDAIENLYLKS